MLACRLSRQQQRRRMSDDPRATLGKPNPRAKESGDPSLVDNMRAASKKKAGRKKKTRKR